MPRRHRREDLLAAALLDVVELGLAGLTFGRVARRLGVADRTIVYYFPSKEVLVADVVGAFATQVQTLLGAAFGQAVLPADELARRAWPLLATVEADRAFAVFFELSGLAASGAAPFPALAEALVGEWVTWLGDRIEGPNPATRRDGAAALLARLDGVLLLRQVGHADLADRIAPSVLWDGDGPLVRRRGGMRPAKA